jgi:hypothetical protein
LGAAVLASVLFLAPLPGSASAAASALGCRPATPAQAPATTGFYDPQRPYLGPAPLPTGAPVGPLLVGYQRFGPLSEDAFLATYRTGAGWAYPPSDGFLILAGIAIRYAQTMVTGIRIDRFGYAGGAYLAPAGTPFINRALPPQNLNTPGGTPASNYHLYCVVRAFTVDAGPIAPWFGQIGLGLQYKLDSRYLPEAGSALSVTWLLTNGYLVEEAPA